MNRVSEYVKEIIYSTLAVASGLFIYRLFSKRKLNKKIMFADNKKLLKRLKLFFNEEIKGTKLQLKQEEEIIIELDPNKLKEEGAKYGKLMEFLKNVENNENSDEKKVSLNKLMLNDDNSLRKEEQIFFYLFNNFSKMIIEANKQKAN